jgi:hypothetical protein
MTGKSNMLKKAGATRTTSGSYALIGSDESGWKINEQFMMVFSRFSGLKDSISGY